MRHAGHGRVVGRALVIVGLLVATCIAVTTGVASATLGAAAGAVASGGSPVERPARAPFVAPRVTFSPPEAVSSSAPSLDALHGEPDSPRLAVLSAAPIASIEAGRGGRSLGFEITFEDGSRAYFKPEAVRTSTRWFAEVAAYQLDRELGLGRVAPSVVRELEAASLRAAAPTDPRWSEVVVRDGRVRGAMIWWIPERLHAVETPAGWERWVRLEAPARVTPYQAAPFFRRGLAQPDAPGGVTPPADRADRAAELSDMIVFDYLTANHDRWGGNNTNIRTRGEGGAIVYLDNGAGFPPGPLQRNDVVDARIEALQRFRASTVDALRSLDHDALAARLSAHGEPLLTERQLAGLEERRLHALAHVDALVAAHGAPAVLSL